MFSGLRISCENEVLLSLEWSQKYCVKSWFRHSLRINDGKITWKRSPDVFEVRSKCYVKLSNRDFAILWGSMMEKITWNRDSDVFEMGPKYYVKTKSWQNWSPDKFEVSSKYYVKSWFHHSLRINDVKNFVKTKSRLLWGEKILREKDLRLYCSFAQNLHF